MADNGLGDLLYLGGVDLSGDIGAIREISGGPAVVDVTNLTQTAASKLGTTYSGKLGFDAWFDPVSEHPVLKTLPTADVIATYVHGATATAPAAGLVAKQADYPGTRGSDGSLMFAVDLQSTGSGVEWGQGYVGGPFRTDTAATNGVGIDDGNPTSSGLSAYLHVLSFTGSTAVVIVQHSADNGVSDAWTTVVSFQAVTGGSTAQRVTTTASPVKRWLRCSTTGTFSNLKFYVMASRLTGLVFVSTTVAVDIQTFTSSGTWTKPAGVTTVLAWVIGGGGGGGSGPQRATGIDSSGGGAGGGGARSLGQFPVTLLGATETVIVGLGGTGGARVTTDNTNGNPGTGGGASTFGTTVRLRANGGSAGAAGVASSSAVAGVAALGVFNGGAAVDSLTGVASGAPGASGGAAAAGGNGGGFTAGNVGLSGANGGDSLQLNNTGHGVGGASLSVSGTAATGAPIGDWVGGPGGGGGAASDGASGGGAGGVGGLYGGGGGGGGASQNFDFVGSGAGGVGAAGLVVVVSW